MPPRQLKKELEITESHIIETLFQDSFNGEPSYPKSFSDAQYCVRKLLRMFHVKRRPIAIDLDYVD